MLYVIVLGALALLVATLLVMDLLQGHKRRRRREQRSLQIVFRVPNSASGDAAMGSRLGSDHP